MSEAERNECTAPPTGSVWVILDRREHKHALSSGMAFSSREICETYCRLPGDTPFEVHVIDKPRTPNRAIDGK